MSKTNNFKLVDFKIKNKANKEFIYGINISKIKEIINLPSITKLPNVNKNIEGLIDLRGKTIPIINLISLLEKENSIEKKVLVANFNNIEIGFLIGEPRRIREINYKKIKTIKNQKKDSFIISSTLLEDENQLLLIIDLEIIIKNLGFLKIENIPFV